MDPENSNGSLYMAAQAKWSGTHKERPQRFIQAKVFDTGKSDLEATDYTSRKIDFSGDGVIDIPEVIGGNIILMWMVLSCAYDSLACAYLDRRFLREG